MRFPFLLLASCVAALLPAQTAERDLQKLLEPLTDAPSLYFENQYLWYTNDAPTPIDTLDGVFQRQGGRQYLRMGRLELLDLDGLTVTADHQDRIVSVQRSLQPIKLDNPVDAGKLQELIAARTIRVTYGPARSPWKSLQVTDPERPDYRLILYYDPTDRMIREVSVTTTDPFADPLAGVAEPVTIVVRYLNISRNPKEFSHQLGQYVRKSGQGYTPAGKCKGYRVI